MTAAAIGGVAGSPNPPNASPDSTMCTSIVGEVDIRTISYSGKFPCSTRPFFIVISPYNAAVRP